MSRRSRGWRMTADHVEPVDLDQAREAVDRGRRFRRTSVAMLLRCGVRRERRSEVVAHNITTLLQRWQYLGAGNRRLITELQLLRELLQQEGARVQREVTEIRTLSQSATQLDEIIAESLANWKSDSNPRTARI